MPARRGGRRPPPRMPFFAAAAVLSRPLPSRSCKSVVHSRLTKSAPNWIARPCTACVNLRAWSS
eukprot:1991108-Pyramimonas_sp.AAC.1